MYQTNWNKYYTPISVASEIISMVPYNFNPKYAIDICVGSANFLKTVQTKWSGVKLIGLDINKVNDEENINYEFHQINALITEELIEKTRNYNSSKIVLANPPFGKISNNAIYKNAIEKYKLIHFEALKTNRIEALMLVSNLSILNEGDYFAAVIPENIFSSKNLKKFKEMFFYYFDNIIVGEPKKYFKGSEVRTRIFIGCFSIKEKRKISLDCKKLNEKKFELLRGIDNSKLINENELKQNLVYNEVLHFSNKSGIIKSKRFIEKKSNFDRLIVTKNDSLILRVGRNTGNSYSIKENFLNKYISDYFYLLKGINFKRKEHIKLQELLIKKRKGLTTNYLSKYDIIDSINEVLNDRL